MHYGLFDAAGNLDMRLSIDHRVLDGALTARCLVELDAFDREIFDELVTMRSTAKAA